MLQERNEITKYLNWKIVTLLPCLCKDMFIWNQYYSYSKNAKSSITKCNNQLIQKNDIKFYAHTTRRWIRKNAILYEMMIYMTICIENDNVKCIIYNKEFLCFVMIFLSEKCISLKLAHYTNYIPHFTNSSCDVELTNLHIR